MVPPGSPEESCATGTQCDDTGRCVAPSAQPASSAPSLTANPAALTTVPGGAPASLQVQLTMFAGGAALLAAATTPVRAVGNDGAEVSCDGGASFAHECTLTAWTFAFDGAKYNASKTLLTHTTTGTSLGAGQIHLRIDAIDSDTVVPVSAATAVPTTPDGDYHGLVTHFAVPAGIPVTVHVRDRYFVVEDKTRTLAPDGAFVTSNLTPTNPSASDWRLFWMDAPGVAHTSSTGIYADYMPTQMVFDAATGTVRADLRLKLLNNQINYRLNATRDTGPAAHCLADSECSDGWVCPIQLQVCVPPSAWAGGPTNPSFLDPRSSQWFELVRPLLGKGTTLPAGARAEFATTGAEFIESLACTNASNGAGHLGVTQLIRGSGPSRSGDLRCVADTNTNLGIATPGPVGLSSYYDRKGTAPAQALLQTCLTELASKPNGSFGTAFSSTNGDCVNLARALPALRLLATGELNKQTAVLNGTHPDERLATLMRRLVQQWSQLHGFIATTGLEERSYQDAIAATPAQGRANLISLLDTLDKGWAALLDDFVRNTILQISGSEDGSDEDLFWPQFDYRGVKKPVVYWPLNGGNRFDLINNVGLATLKPPCITLTCTPPPPTCLLGTANSFKQNWNCPGLGGSLPSTVDISSGGNLSVTFNVDPLDAEFPIYSGGTILATSTLAVFESWDAGGEWLNLAHPTASGTPEVVAVRAGGFGYWTSGTTGDDVGNPPKGTQVAVVRDSLAQKYTVYIYDPLRNGGVTQVLTAPYAQPVQGALPSVSPGRVLVGAGPWGVPNTGFWGGSPARRSSFAAHIDDVAVWSSMISQREFERFARDRAFDQSKRAVYPLDMTLVDFGTQEIKTPVATEVLNAQIAHLELADRLAVQMRYQAQAACDTGDDAARIDVNNVIARLGRTVRQSTALQALVGNGDSDSANANRVLLGAKTSQLLRDMIALTECRNPYGMAEHEVPLYFGSIAPTSDEKAAFFAASDHLLQLAEQRTQTAQAALDGARAKWDQARQSQIAELQDATSRAIRVDELTTKYGDALIRLCGISDRTADQVIADVRDGSFSVDTCFIKPPTGNQCPTSNTSGPIMDADPTCYRGAIGSALIDINTAFHAQQAAYQAWQAAAGNSAAATKLCVLKEMDVFGCSAVDRNALAGVTCPAGHHGTIELIDNYLHEMIQKEAEKSWFDAVLHIASTIASAGTAYATGGPGAAFLTVAVGVMQPISTEMGNSMEDRKRAHEATLQKRALIEDVQACWTSAEQYERAIAAAEQTSQESQSRLQGAVLAFENGLAEAREVTAVAPQEIDRELERPAIPIAFHYWLPEALETYQIAYESARRYTYMALRATEYDTLDDFALAQAGKPSRSTVLGAWLPSTLANELAKARDLTNTRQTVAGPPRLGHLTFDLGAKFFGLDESSPDFGAALLQYAQPVYSSHGEYLGMGVRFSLVPSSEDEAPTWRCAERIWRVNLGATGFPTTSDGTHVKLLKRNVFASRRCDGEGFQVATLRPGGNLLVGSGDASTYVAENVNSVADVALMDFNQPDALFNFKTRDDFLNGSSSELALQELYGDYVLLFPASAFTTGLDLGQLRDFFLRFDFLSIDNTPPITAVMAKPVANASAPIVLPGGSR